MSKDTKEKKTEYILRKKERKKERMKVLIEKEYKLKMSKYTKEKRLNTSKERKKEKMKEWKIVDREGV